MIDPQVMNELVRLAVAAPSGDNMQPWDIRVREDALEVRFLPDLAKSVLDCADTASRLAYGAMLENVALAASVRGLSATWVLDPEPDDPRLWARVTFSPAPPVPSHLADAIERRSTNRALFDRSPLAPEVVAALLASNANDSVLEIITEPRAIEELGKITGLAEQVRSSIREAHEGLHHALRWSTEEVERTRDGLDVRTLGLSGMERWLLRVFAPWPRARYVMGLGGTRIQGRYTRKQARTASAFAWIGVHDFTPAALVEAGRTLQRVWLEATAQGLQVSPFAAFPLLVRAQALDPSVLGKTEARRLAGAATREAALRAGRPGTCVMLLRIGRAPPASLRSLRRHPSPDRTGASP